MCRFVVLALLAVGLAGCGSSAAKPVAIEYGTTGGNLVPTKALVKADGQVQGYTLIGGGPRCGTPASCRHLHSFRAAAVRSFDRQVRGAFAAGLVSRQCPSTLPDMASEYIRFEGRTVQVRGYCEPRFSALWNKLAETFG